ncbi:hypothetical protein [Micromonospora sp. MW-13]|uniref:hypothetical protein n=1 Tax=Micromonospora sp. MW-13 TaxID=2094022 RepID=UPI0014045CCC|nr:hypothetical protein [Micromonospora sp. MW-13]
MTGQLEDQEQEKRMQQAAQLASGMSAPFLGGTHCSPEAKHAFTSQRCRLADWGDLSRTVLSR